MYRHVDCAESVGSVCEDLTVQCISSDVQNAWIYATTPPYMLLY